MVFTETEMKDSLTRCLEKYSANGIHKSVQRNSHMNECDGLEFEDSKAKELIENYINYVSPRLKKDSPKVSDIVFEMANQIPRQMAVMPAPTLDKDHYKKDYYKSVLNQKVQMGVLVDFVNYFAYFAGGMDFGMYTRDVYSEINKGKPMEPEYSLFP